MTWFEQSAKAGQRKSTGTTPRSIDIWTTAKELDCKIMKTWQFNAGNTDKHLPLISGRASGRLAGP